MSVAHLDDDERAMVLGLVLEEAHAWMRTLSGTSALRALVLFDEVYGYLPPHPANPPTKRPLTEPDDRVRSGRSVIVPSPRFARFLGPPDENGVHP